GRSQGWVESFGARATAKEIAAALDTLRIERAHLVAWSWSGVVAAWMADDEPERIASMSLVASTITQEAEGTGDRTFERTKYALGYVFLVALPAFVPHFGLFGPLESRNACSRNIWDTDFCPMLEVLQRLRTPTLLVHGREDFQAASWGAELHRSLIPGARLVMTPHGHFLPMEGPIGQAD